MKILEEPIDYAEVLKNAAQSALAGYESSIAHGGIRDEEQENWILSLFSGMQAIALVAELKQRLAQVERERDAAVTDLVESAKAGAVCTGCAHNAGLDAMCESADFDCKTCKNPCKCKTCDDNNNYEWRGVFEENSKEDKNG